MCAVLTTDEGFRDLGNPHDRRTSRHVKKEGKTSIETRCVLTAYLCIFFWRCAYFDNYALEGLETTNSPYSKSHNRRMKRKSKEQIAGGLSDMQAAISALDETIPTSVQNSIEAGDDHARDSKSKPHVKPGMIGEGKKATLSKSQRKRALYVLKYVMPPVSLTLILVKRSKSDIHLSLLMQISPPTLFKPYAPTPKTHF